MASLFSPFFPSNSQRDKRQSKQKKKNKEKVIETIVKDELHVYRRFYVDSMMG